jgi:hypothetical protein
MYKNPEISKILYNAFKYHAINSMLAEHDKMTSLGGRSKKGDKIICSFSHREELRNLSLKGASVPEEFIKSIVELSKIAHQLKTKRNITTTRILEANN